MKIKYLGLLLVLPLAAAMADQTKAEKTPPDPTLNPALLSAGILQNYPDLMFRQWGMNAFEKKNYERAFAYFRRASFYADKPAQGMVAEMFWDGRGVAQDRAMAYAWMDLAAERGYPMFVVQREKYWNQLNETERTRALDEGQAVYARFGDEGAKVRYANQLRWKQKEATGSHLGGFAGTSVQIQLPSATGDEGGESLDASKFYDPKNFDAQKYWERTDRVWSKLRNPKVTVGEVVQAGEAKGEQSSRVPETKPDVDAKEPEIPDSP